MNFLLIEDNPSISEGLEYTFKQNNYNLSIASTLLQAKEYIENNKYDLIILDVLLPDGNGIKFYKNYLKEKNILVLFLSAVDDEDEVVDALNEGAQEYMTKPFSTKELLVRIKRILNNKSNIIKIKNISYDLDKMSLFKDNEEIQLTSLENKILNVLFSNVGKVVTRQVLLDKIWQWTGNDVDDHTITVYLKRIREKIGDEIITTVKGIGYRID